MTNGSRIQPGQVQNMKLSQSVSRYWAPMGDHDDSGGDVARTDEAVGGAGQMFRLHRLDVALVGGLLLCPQLLLRAGRRCFPPLSLGSYILYSILFCFYGPPGCSTCISGTACGSGLRAKVDPSSWEVTLGISGEQEVPYGSKS